jgi:hypothetical protein
MHKPVPGVKGWSIKEEMKLTESLEDVNSKAAGKLRHNQLFSGQQ